MSEKIYSGAEFKRLLKEGIPGYKPVIGGNAESKNKKINKEANRESIKNTKLKNTKEESKPVIGRNGQSTDLGNNKNMLDLQYVDEPSKEWKDRVKQQVTGEDSNQGNSPTEDSAIEGNKQFYKDAKSASKGVIDNDHIAKTSGLVSKNLDIPKKPTAFKESRFKRLNFRNTIFLSENHMRSLIPNDYKKDGNKFIMKDKESNEYFIEWNLKGNISEGIILKYENKKKINEEFDKIKHLYSYKSKDHTSYTKQDENSLVEENLNKLRKVSEEE